MDIITITTNNKKELSTLKKILKALEVNFTHTLAADETDYLLSTEANRKSLDKSLEQANMGKVVKVDIDDLWK